MHRAYLLIIHVPWRWWTGLEKMKETLKVLDFTSKLLKISIYSPDINWKPWDLLTDSQKDIPHICTWANIFWRLWHSQFWEKVHLMGVIQTFQELLQLFQKIFWKTYLQCNDLHKLLGGKKPKLWWGHCWL